MQPDHVKNPCAAKGFLAYLATSFLGAFNDNCFKLLLTCFAMSRLSPEAQKSYIPLVGAMFALPFLLCSGYAGFLSDRFAKRQVLVWAKWLELAVMLLGLLLFRRQAVYPLLLVLFLMGAQSAIYSPAKYGFLPETLPESSLSKGNGYTQLCTFLAIIAGTWVGGAVSALHSKSFWLGSLYCVAVALLGIPAAYATSHTPEGSPNAKRNWNPVSIHLRTLRKISRDRLLLSSFFGNTYFWFVAALFQNNLPLYVRQNLGLGNQALGYLLGAVGLGIGLGGAACGALSRGRIEFGLVLPGGIFMALACLAMGFPGGPLWLVLSWTAALGFFAGIYQLPLSATMQKLSPPEIRGSCLAFGNALDCVSMLLAYTVQWFLLKPCRRPPEQVFLALGAITAIVLLLMAAAIPELRLRTRLLFSRTKRS